MLGSGPEQMVGLTLSALSANDPAAEPKSVSE